MINRRIISVDSSELLSDLAGSVLIDLTAKAIQERGRATVLVSGGTSIWRAYEAYGRASSIDWSKVYIFWGDERFVEPENPYSNYALVRDALLSHTNGLPRENVFPVNFDAATPAACAEEYDETIRAFFALQPGEWPVFDLAQIGMGSDGHTASLFPHSPALSVTDRIAVMNHAGFKPWVDRITLTMPVFNNARAVLFVASGPSKAGPLKHALEGSPTLDEMPAAHVDPVNGALFWLLDQEASAQLAIPLETAY